MTRRDWKTLAWLLPLALALTLWLRVRVNPCIVDEVVVHWRKWFPPSTDITQSPYGLVVCDYWPQWYDHMVNIAILVVVSVVVGVLCRKFEHRVAAWAASIMASALVLTFLLSWLVHLPRDYRWNAFEFAVTAGLVAFAACTAAFAAWLARRQRRGA